MRRLISVGAIALVAILLSACAASQPTLPASWESKGSDGVRHVSWTLKDGDVSGTVEETAKDDSGNAASSSYPVTGRIADGKVTLKVGGGGSLGGAQSLSGTVTATAMTLSGDAAGTIVRWEFTPASASQYRSDAEAYTAKVRAEQNQQQDQDAYNQAVARLTSSVAALQTALSAQQTASAAESAEMVAYRKAIAAATAGSCYNAATADAATTESAKLGQSLQAVQQADEALSTAAGDVTQALNAAPLASGSGTQTSAPDLGAAKDLVAKATQAAATGAATYSADSSTRTSSDASVNQLTRC